MCGLTGVRMDQSPYLQIGKLMAEGASLGEIETYVESRTTGKSEEQRSAAWLVDWHAREHPPRPPIPPLMPPDAPSD